MKLHLNITMVDGETEKVPVRPSTQVAYERHFKTTLSNDIGMEQLYWLAWKASGVVPKFETWLDDLDGVEAEVAGEEGDVGDIDPLAQNQPSGT
jgi:hypothetical protein